MALTDKLTAIADAIRGKTGKTDGLTLDAMPGEIEAIQTGGGSDLNFKVCGNPKPSNPENNTIWVDTDADISEYIFSATPPNNPIDGCVWFATGTNSDISFSATENNPIVLYLCSARQYISGEWAYVYAEIYQNDVWLEWKTSIFKENAETTPDYRVWQESTTASTINIGDCIELSYTNESSGFISIVSQFTIDVTVYTKLCVEAKTSVLRGGTYAPRFGLTRDYSTGWNSRSDWVASQLYEKGEERKIYQLDISEISGSYWVWVHWGNSHSSIYNVWLE